MGVKKIGAFLYKLVKSGCSIENRSLLLLFWKRLCAEEFLLLVTVFEFTGGNTRGSCGKS